MKNISTANNSTIDKVHHLTVLLPSIYVTQHCRRLENGATTNYLNSLECACENCGASGTNEVSQLQRLLMFFDLHLLLQVWIWIQEIVEPTLGDCSQRSMELYAIKHK